MRKLGTSLSICAATLLLSSCSIIEDSKWPKADLDKNPLDGVEYAIYMSPQTVGPQAIDKGYLALIKEDGSYSTIKTSGMDAGRIIWTKEGLHFTDSEKDYLLTEEGLESWDAPKPKHNLDYFLLQDGSTIGLYNEGGSNGSYKTRVVSNRNGDINSFSVEGAYLFSGLCNDENIVAWSETTGEHRTDGKKEDMLSIIDMEGEVEKVVAKYPLIHEGSGGSLQCVDNTVYFIETTVNNVEGKPETGDLIAWNIENGDYTNMHLVDQEGNPTPTTDDTGAGHIRVGYMGNEAIQDGQLGWFIKDKVMSTDIETGVTKELFTVSPSKEHGSSSDAIFRKDDILFLSQNRDEETALVRYDRNTGEELDRVVVDGLAKETSSNTGLIIRGFASKPE